jgi:molybdopterin converting factor small subunit
MSVQVRVPSALRAVTGGLTAIVVEAGDVAHALRQLEAAYPALAPVLRDERGALRPRVNLYVNDVHVRFLQGLDTPLEEGDQLYVTPVVMGG